LEFAVVAFRELHIATNSGCDVIFTKEEGLSPPPDQKFDLFIVLPFKYEYYVIDCGPGSSVGIATDYGLDGPGSNPGGDEIFHPSRPAVGLTQPPVNWVPGLSRG
jgi:hypothetical protein